MPNGGSEFVKMIQKNNKCHVFFFCLCCAGGKINRAGQLAPGGEDNQGGGGKISRDSLSPGGKKPRLACPHGNKLSRGQDKLGHRFRMCQCSLTQDVK